MEVLNKEYLRNINHPHPSTLSCYVAMFVLPIQSSNACGLSSQRWIKDGIRAQNQITKQPKQGLKIWFIYFWNCCMSRTSFCWMPLQLDIDKGLGSIFSLDSGKRYKTKRRHSIAYSESSIFLLGPYMVRASFSGRKLCFSRSPELHKSFTPELIVS